MQIDRKALKRAAKETIRISRPRPTLVTLGYGALVYGVSIAVAFVTTMAMGGADLINVDSLSGGTTMLTLFLTLAAGFFTSVMGFGYSIYTLRLSRGEEAGFSTIISGFAQTGRVILMNLILAGFYMVWAMAVLFPAMMLMTVVMLAMIQTSMALALTIMYIIYFAALILLLYLLVRYSLASLALADNPEAGALAAVRRSRALLRGRHGEAFKLQLSFLGWYLAMFAVILAVMLVGGLILMALNFTINIARFNGMLMLAVMLVSYLLMIPMACWVTPYTNLTMAGYYRLLAEPVQSELPDLNVDRPEPF